MHGPGPKDRRPRGQRTGENGELKQNTKEEEEDGGGGRSLPFTPSFLPAVTPTTSTTMSAQKKGEREGAKSISVERASLMPTKKVKASDFALVLLQTTRKGFCTHCVSIEKVIKYIKCLKNN